MFHFMVDSCNTSTYHFILPLKTSDMEKRQRREETGRAKNRGIHVRGDEKEVKYRDGVREEKTCHININKMIKSDGLIPPPPLKENVITVMLILSQIDNKEYEKVE